MSTILAQSLPAAVPFHPGPPRAHGDRAALVLPSRPRGVAGRLVLKAPRPNATSRGDVEVRRDDPGEG